MEERFPISRDAVRGGVYSAVQHHRQRISGEDLGSLGKRRVSQMQRIKLPSLLFHLIVRVIHRRDLHDFPLCDVGST